MASNWPRNRIAGLLALAVPVLIGIVWMTLAGARNSYPLINGLSLIFAMGWALFGRAPQRLIAVRLLAIALIAVLVIAVLAGPQLHSITHDRVSRWLALGPVQLHSGMVALPAIAVLAARDADYSAPILLAALFASFLQPDAASGFAVTFAAIGLHHVTQDWKHGMVAIIGFFASILMALKGELPPQPFVERVVQDALMQNWPIALVMIASILANYFLILKMLPMHRSERFALAGTLFGFALMALLSHYPTPLIGYGAAPILGYGLAIGLTARETT